jgi:hypothetical protein
MRRRVLQNATAVSLLLLPLLVAHAQTDPSQVTLLRVLADPDKYHGQEVQLIGYLHLEFEGNGLYLHKEDYDNSIIGNVIWIDPTPEMLKVIDRINDKYVVVRGVFDAKDHGHMGLFSGVLSRISRCDIWSDPGQPRRSRKVISGPGFVR